MVSCPTLNSFAAANNLGSFFSAIRFINCQFSQRGQISHISNKLKGPFMTYLTSMTSLTSFILFQVTDRSTQPCIQFPVQDKRLVRFVQAIRQPAVAEVSLAFRSMYTLGLLLCPVNVLIGISATIYAAGISQSPISTIRVQP